eukprot:660725-Amphidinium_carterae.1
MCKRVPTPHLGGSENVSPHVDNASRAANRHVLQVKSTEQRFQHAPRVWRLLLHFGSGPA